MSSIIGLEMKAGELAELQMLRDSGLLNETEYNDAVAKVSEAQCSTHPDILNKPVMTPSEELKELELLRETGLLSDTEFNDAAQRLKEVKVEDTASNPPKSPLTEGINPKSHEKENVVSDGLIQELKELKEQGLLSQVEFDEAIAELIRKSQSEPTPTPAVPASAPSTESGGRRIPKVERRDRKNRPSKEKSSELVELEDLRKLGILSESEFEIAVANLSETPASEASQMDDHVTGQIAEFQSLKEQGLLSESEFTEAVAALSI